MEKTYKRVPFNIELAKKIQAGEVEGRINGDLGIVRIICFDRKSQTPIIALYKTNCGRFECPCFVFPDGRVDGAGEELFIELPEETPKHEFKPFDKVLVKRYIEPKISLRFPGIGHYWLPSFYQYSINDEGTIYYVAGNKVWEQCIPYEGNEHLVGTTDNPKMK